MILVTGASGLLGANLVYHAVRRAERVVAMYHRHTLRAPDAEVVQADITDHQAVNELISRRRPRWIVHCAALTNVDWCQGHRDLVSRVNVEASRNLAAAARLVGSRLVYLSTDSVFDGVRGRYSESDAPGPVNVYAASKLAGERAVREELPQALIVRTNLYGWNAQNKASLAEWVFDGLTSGRRVLGFRDVVFTPILANDLSEIVLDMIDRDLSGVYHVAASEPCSKYDFALKVAATFGLPQELVIQGSIEDSALKAPRPRNTTLDTGKVERSLERSMPGVDAGLQRMRDLRDSGFESTLKSWCEGGNDA